MRNMEEWEKDLLQENAALLAIAEAWMLFVKATSVQLRARGEYLEPHLRECIKYALGQVKGLLYYGGQLTLDEKGTTVEVQSIKDALKESNDEIIATQAGKETKDGTDGPVVAPPPTRRVPPDSRGRRRRPG